jgi:hypothetical protein
MQGVLAKLCTGIISTAGLSATCHNLPLKYGSCHSEAVKHAAQCGLLANTSMLTTSTWASLSTTHMRCLCHAYRVVAATLQHAAQDDYSQTNHSMQASSGCIC